MLQLLIFPLLFPSLRTDPTNVSNSCFSYLHCAFPFFISSQTFCYMQLQGAQISATTSLYLFCCIVRILKIKNLANTIAVALLCLLEAFTPRSEVKQNGNIFGHSFTQENHSLDKDAVDAKADNQLLKITVPTSPSSSQIHSAEDFSLQHNCSGPHLALRWYGITCHWLSHVLSSLALFSSYTLSYLIAVKLTMIWRRKKVLHYVFSFAPVGVKGSYFIKIFNFIAEWKT